MRPAAAGVYGSRDPTAAPPLQGGRGVIVYVFVYVYVFVKATPLYELVVR
jgi:hypothetical protein